MTPLIATRVLSGALVGACLVVLTAVAVHSAALGPNPDWLFDCNDTTCEDLWITARVHYRSVGVAALAVGVLGWLLVGVTLRTAVARADDTGAAPAGTGVAYATATALAPITVLGALVGSRSTMTGMLAVTAWCAAVASSLVWWSLRAHTRRERFSWFGAAFVVVAVYLTGGVAAALLFPALFVIAPLAATPAAGVAGALAVRLVLASAVAAPPAEPVPGRSAGRGVRVASWGAVAVGLVAIAMVSYLAARPVPAPPADAVTASVDQASGYGR